MFENKYYDDFYIDTIDFSEDNHIIDNGFVICKEYSPWDKNFRKKSYENKINKNEKCFNCNNNLLICFSCNKNEIESCQICGYFQTSKNLPEYLTCNDIDQCNYNTFLCSDCINKNNTGKKCCNCNLNTKFVINCCDKSMLNEKCESCSKDYWTINFCGDCI